LPDPSWRFAEPGQCFTRTMHELVVVHVAEAVDANRPQVALLPGAAEREAAAAVVVLDARPVLGQVFEQEQVADRVQDARDAPVVRRSCDREALGLHARRLQRRPRRIELLVGLGEPRPGEARRQLHREVPALRQQLDLVHGRRHSLVRGFSRCALWWPASVPITRTSRPAASPPRRGPRLPPRTAACRAFVS